MIELIPAIDIINGQCVRLTCGDYDAQTVYSKIQLMWRNILKVSDLSVFMS